jgi:hypothetical protein
MLLSSMTSILSFFNSLLSLEWSRLSALLDAFFWHNRHDGLYEVLEHHTTLELLDPFGKEAFYRKQQTIRFLQNNIISYQDKAWGDGDIFASYRCSPGKAVDRYREGLFYWVLISLRASRQRGDIEHVDIERGIENGFTHREEDWQTDIDHPTRQLSIGLIFPATHYPKRVSLMQQSNKKSVDLQPSHYRALADGRLEIRWTRHRLRKGEGYTMHWEW